MSTATMPTQSVPTFMAGKNYNAVFNQCGDDHPCEVTYSHKLSDDEHLIYYSGRDRRATWNEELKHFEFNI